MTRPFRNQTLGELEAIQDLLKDQSRVKKALKDLELQVSRNTSEKDETANSALNLALQDEEQQWMNPGRIKVGKKSSITRQDPKTKREESERVRTIPGLGLQERPSSLSSTSVSRVLVPLRALKDIGAGPAMGSMRNASAVVHHLVLVPHRVHAA